MSADGSTTSAEEIAASTDAPRPPESRLHSIAVVLASLIIAVPMLFGRLTEAILDTINPANVDVTQPLAYLSEILAWGFGSLGVLLIALVSVLVVLRIRTRSFKALRLPVLIAVVQIVVGILTLWLSGLADGS
ncbi:hypothetical protein [Microbacterium esteraromaticum]|uniref:hypothetical protein n=1 Tax=Microbacterium esteraromaticum TaxID=57043 RepID=UPI000B34E12C|nr:hypothetical protein [Microbacterium esteraromaticum]